VNPLRNRTAILSISIGAILAAEIATMDFRDMGARVRRALGPHELVRDRLAGTDFLFDPGYGPFLDRIARTTPPEASLRLCMPRTNELYDYAAAYFLAPRPVRRDARADFSWRCPDGLSR
jgi:hypothetical protein